MERTSEPRPHVCERCGSHETFEACEGRWLCEDCYHLAGSCCLEFGADDLWKARESVVDTARGGG